MIIKGLCETPHRRVEYVSGDVSTKDKKKGGNFHRNNNDNFKRVHFIKPIEPNLNYLWRYSPWPTPF